MLQKCWGLHEGTQDSELWEEIIGILHLILRFKLAEQVSGYNVIKLENDILITKSWRSKKGFKIKLKRRRLAEAMVCEYSVTGLSFSSLNSSVLNIWGTHHYCACLWRRVSHTEILPTSPGHTDRSNAVSQVTISLPFLYNQIWVLGWQSVFLHLIDVGTLLLLITDIQAWVMPFGFKWESTHCIQDRIW